MHITKTGFTIKFWSTLYVGLQPNFTLDSFTTENLATLSQPTYIS